MDIGVSIHKDHEFARRIAQLEHHFEMKKKLDSQIIEHLAAEKRALYVKLGEQKRKQNAFYSETLQFIKDNVSGGNSSSLVSKFEDQFKTKYFDSIQGLPRTQSRLAKRDLTARPAAGGAGYSKQTTGSDFRRGAQQSDDRSASIPKYAGRETGPSTVVDKQIDSISKPTENQASKSRTYTTNTTTYKETNVQKQKISDLKKPPSIYNLRDKMGSKQQDGENTQGSRLGDQVGKAYELRGQVTRQRTSTTPDRTGLAGVTGTSTIVETKESSTIRSEAQEDTDTKNSGNMDFYAKWKADRDAKNSK